MFEEDSFLNLMVALDINKNIVSIQILLVIADNSNI